VAWRGVAWRGDKDPPQHRFGFGRSFQGAQHAAERDQGIGGIRTNQQRLAEIFCGRLVILELALAQRQVLKKLGIPRIEVHRFLERTKRLVETALGGQCDAKHFFENRRVAGDTA
jgi:hypothetical protein